MTEVVNVRGLRLAYGSVVVLENVDLSVRQGEVVAVTGVNGAGKSTLLSCLAGFRRPAEGTVSVLGGPPRDDAGFWRSVALVADQPTWYPGLTVRELLELVQLSHGVSGTTTGPASVPGGTGGRPPGGQPPLGGWRLTTDELIDQFGLAARADASPLSLSSGQRQRLSLAAALARPSRLLLLDEPEQSLDAGFRQDLAALLNEGYAAGGGSVVMATHDPDFAATAGARVVALAEGTLAGTGS